MSELEEADEAILTAPKIGLVEQSTLDLMAAGSLVRHPQSGHAPGSPRVPAHPYHAMLTTILLKILRSAQQALAGDAKQADSLIAKAAALINAEIEHQNTARRSLDGVSTRRHLAPWQARRVTEFVETNLADAITLEDLAETARLSVSHFAKAFRWDFDQSPHGYIVHRRIERAQEMMLLTDEPLARIAVACGLADQSHLTRLFQRIVGMSPGSWRRMRRSPTQ
jgi:AraC-like DNA-binding protein